MSMTGTYGSTDPHEAAATLLDALDSGVTVFDTGDFYVRDGLGELRSVGAGECLDRLLGAGAVLGVGRWWARMRSARTSSRARVRSRAASLALSAARPTTGPRPAARRAARSRRTTGHAVTNPRISG
ncbi:hypothetical protein GCM10010430_74840 [Kitasatospora cystarginea]|uniref:NADP-dependent oxidoreductase domain-containing protein n=2 Tax=Streptomycetaceae TaxID=2062 RepID=A0ABN3F007_9ACTN